MKIEYELNEAEEKAAMAFLDKHSRCGEGAAIGGAVTWLITPTSIGDFLSVKCARCKKKKFITDHKKL